MLLLRTGRASGIRGQRRRASLREDVGLGVGALGLTQSKGKPFLLNKELLSCYSMLGSTQAVGLHLWTVWSSPHDACILVDLWAAISEWIYQIMSRSNDTIENIRVKR